MQQHSAEYKSVPGDAIETQDLLEAAQPDKWHSIDNLDLFFIHVFDYFVGKGFASIILSRLFSLLMFLFIICFSTFLLTFINYTALFDAEFVKDAIKPRALETVPPFVVICVVLFLLYWMWQVFRLLYDLKWLWEMRKFYSEKLGVDEREIQTIQWTEIVDRLISLQEREKLVLVKEELSAQDIVNRVMRKENYLIGMFNKDLLAFSVPVPGFGWSKVLSKTLEWNLSYCILGVMFDTHHGLRKTFLQESEQSRLASQLRRRFVLMGLLNLLLSPFIIVFLLLWFFFKYTEEFHREPGSLGSRTFSSLARWKLREFNELSNVLQKRLNASFENAQRFVRMFPASAAVTVTARFLTFIVGSFAAVLIALSVVDESIILQLHIGTKSVVWYIGVLGSILAVSRSFIPSESEVFEPELMMRHIAQYLHYFPRHWKGRCHTWEVRDEFLQLFEFRIVIFLQELLSVVFTPFVLMFSLPKCAEQLVQFVRESSVYVDGVGHVCAFGMFNLHKHGDKHYSINANGPSLFKGHESLSGSQPSVDMPVVADDAQGSSQVGPDDVLMKQLLSPAATSQPSTLQTKDGKLEKSFLSFKAQYPDWRPPEDMGGQEFLDNLSAFHANRHQEVLQQTLRMSTQAAVAGAGASVLSTANGVGVQHSESASNDAQQSGMGLGSSSRVAASALASAIAEMGVSSSIAVPPEQMFVPSVKSGLVLPMPPQHYMELLEQYFDARMGAEGHHKAPTQDAVMTNYMGDDM